MPPSRQATARPARIDDSYPPDETLGNQLPKDEYGGSQ